MLEWENIQVELRIHSRVSKIGVVTYGLTNNGRQALNESV